MCLFFRSFLGPATIRMVSTNSTPPTPLPMNVPPGHMVQQILDQNGTLQHVILSPDPMSSYGGAPQGAVPPPSQPPPPPPPPQQQQQGVPAAAAAGGGAHSAAAGVAVSAAAASPSVTPQVPIPVAYVSILIFAVEILILFFLTFIDYLHIECSNCLFEFIHPSRA